MKAKAAIVEVIGPAIANAGLEIIAPCGPVLSVYPVSSSWAMSLVLLAAAMLSTGLFLGLGLTLLSRNRKRSSPE